MKNNPVLHPFLFTISPVLILLSNNIHELWSISELCIVLLAVTVATGIVLTILKIIVKDWHTAAHIASLGIFLFFSYGYFCELIWAFSFTLFGSVIGRNVITLFVWTCIFSTGTVALLKNRSKAQPVTYHANVFGLLLVIVPVITIIFTSLTNKTAPGNRREQSAFPLVSIQSIKQPMRDIYYIVLDRYAGAPTLKTVYHFDNSPFLSALRQRGFYIASESYANYPRTSLSLSSSLNMQYIGYLRESLGEDEKNKIPLYNLMNNHIVGKTLKSLGYRYIHFGSYHIFTRRVEIADVNLNNYMIPEFTMALYRSTALYPLGEKLGLLNAYTTPRRSILFKFEKIKTIPAIKKPTFVFAHFLLPHLPYIFDRNGAVLSDRAKQTMSLNEQYIEQLRFTNSRILTLVDSLISKSSPKPIIILQSDEGPFPSEYQKTPASYKTFRYARVSDRELKQKLGILNAYYMPDTDTGTLYPTITPVNSFRVLFNHYFNAHLPLLPDKCYAVKDEDHPYSFFEVTDRLFPH